MNIAPREHFDVEATALANGAVHQMQQIAAEKGLLFFGEEQTELLHIIARAAVRQSMAYCAELITEGWDIRNAKLK